MIICTTLGGLTTGKRWNQPASLGVVHPFSGAACLDASMDALPVDPRDETWEVRSPKYRVYFFAGTASNEFELDARDVVEALAWAEDNRGRRTYALYVCAAVNGMGLVLLAGADPNSAAQSAAMSAGAFASTLVLTNQPTVDRHGQAQTESDAPEPGKAEHLAAQMSVLDRAVTPVLRDLRSTGAPEPGIGGHGWVDDPLVASAMLAGSTGLIVVIDVLEEHRIAAAASQVQEWVIEEVWGSTTTNWPPCPHHGATHPLRSAVLDGIATWICPNDGTPVSRIGSLPSPGSPLSHLETPRASHDAG